MCRVTVAAWLCKRFVVGAVLSVEEAVGTVSWLTLESRSGEQLAGGLVACGVWRVGVTWRGRGIWGVVCGCVLPEASTLLSVQTFQAWYVMIQWARVQGQWR